MTLVVILLTLLYAHSILTDISIEIVLILFEKVILPAKHYASNMKRREKYTVFNNEID